MPDKITIALDAMGGDHGASVVIPAALLCLSKNPNLHLLLVGQEDVVREHLRTHKAEDHARITIIHASQVVTMKDSPSQAMRRKKDSSMRVAINQVKEGTAQACVSAGNTGALMATAYLVLRTLPGINRPAIISALPTTKENQPVHMLDLGANVDSDPETLVQFAIMGSVLTAAVNNIEKPRVALLNIGEEEIKGNEVVKQTAQLLSNVKNINYIGYIEGDDVYQGVADVVVCDGFVGNVALKSLEGAAKLISHYIHSSFKQNIFTKLIALCALPVLRILRNKIDPARYNGATFIGLQGIVIKSHGNTSVIGFANAIDEAVLEASKNVPQLISKQVQEVLASRTTT